jgi:hypothetical protein
VEAGYERGEHVNDDGQPEGTTITDPATGEVVADPEAYLTQPTFSGVFAGPFTTISLSGPATPVAGTAAEPSGGAVQLDGNGYVTGITATTTAGDSMTFNATGTAPVDTGENTTLDVRWGRWSAGDYTVDINGTQITTAGAFAYAYTENLTSSANLGGLQGQASYSFQDGAPPSATGLYAGDNFVLSQLSFGVDFGTGAITNGQLVLDNQSTGDTWSASQVSASESLSQTFVIPVSGSINGGLGISGEIDGAFVGTNAEGAAVIYTVGGSDSGYVNGSGLVTRP